MDGEAGRQDLVIVRLKIADFIPALATVLDDTRRAFLEHLLVRVAGSEGTAPTIAELSELSRLLLHAAMQVVSRAERHRLARDGLALARLANDAGIQKVRIENTRPRRATAHNPAPEPARAALFISPLLKQFRPGRIRATSGVEARTGR
jgi:hypothetical protein